MIVNQAEAAPVVPVLPMEFFEVIHNVSMYLLLDDAADIGRFSYYNRSDHWYHGSNNIHHPSPLHHWQVAIFGLLFSQIGSVVAKGVEMYQGYRKLENGDFSDLDPDIIDLVEDNSIALEEYQDEVQKTLSLSQDQPSVSSYRAYPKLKSDNVSKTPPKSLVKVPLKVPKPTYLPVYSYQ